MFGLKWKGENLRRVASFMIMAVLFSSMGSVFAEEKVLPQKNISDYYYSWTVHFNDVMDKNSVDADHFYIMDDKGKRLDFIQPVISENDPKKVVLKNHGKFLFEKLYKIYVKEGIRSIDGKPMKDTVSMDFYLEDTLFKEYKTTIHRVNDLGFLDQKPSIFLYIGRTTCPDCVYFNKFLKDVQSDQTIYYVDAEYWKKDAKLKAIREKYHVDWVPALLELKNGELVASFDTKNETNITVKNIEKFLRKEKPLVTIEEVRDFSKFDDNANLFVYVALPTCGHCRRLTEVLKKVHSEKTIYYVDADGLSDVPGYRDFMAKYNVQYYPYLIKIENGKLVKEFKGPRTVEKLEAFLAEN